ncbi:hypothetical protein D8I35_11970 [Corticibacter populi]|uniref:SMP-30/Gluconolactonase/LRE-like region domain-containing protein n=1 Tax=Corticibacter populi TaxID=1550736 RepID=A0A3M6QSA2_9BURK|nr:hypothetical protein [Corticibacter populi]RMX05863.1 hypothetical protein D8I35_11970 [Corticibacter populi]RZS30819.1 hypothetical protein EV687_3013 [Corticibacter populi]
MRKFIYGLWLAFLSVSWAHASASIDFVVENVGFFKPESVVHDPKNDVYLVSNINGSEPDPAGKGFISRISPEDGKVLELKWIRDVQHPSGLAVAGDVLYVSDRREDGRRVVRLFNVDTGQALGVAVHPPGIGSNSLAVLPNGELLGTNSAWKWALLGSEEELRNRGVAGTWRQWDGHLWLPTGGDAVYRIGKDLAVTPFIASPDLRHPNGITTLPNGNALVVSSTGGIFYELTPDGRQTNVRTLPHLGFFDGIGVAPDGAVLVSHDKGVYRIEEDGRAIPVFDLNTHVADFSFDRKRNRILLPLIYAHKLVVAPIPSQGGAQ